MLEEAGPLKDAALPRRRADARAGGRRAGWPRSPRTGSWSSPTPRSPATTPPGPPTPTAGWPGCAGCRRRSTSSRAWLSDLSDGHPGPRPRRLPPLVRRRSGPARSPATCRARLIAGGKSNLTYEVTDGDVVVDRAPPAARPRAGHRARHGPRVHRVISALRRHRRAGAAHRRATAPTTTVLGAPFYVMERVDGHAVPHARPSSTRSAPSAPAAIAGRLVDTLAALHAVDPAAVGLADFGRPEGFLERQVRRWGKQLDASRRPASCPASTSCTRLLGRAAARPTTRGRRDRARRLPARQRADRRRTTGSRPSSTGRWPRSATRSPTSACCWSTQPLGARPAATSSPTSPRRPGYPAPTELLERYAARQRPRRSADIGCYLGARLLQARRDPRGHPLPLPPGPDRRRGLRPDRRAVRPAHRRRPRPPSKES